MRCLRDGKVGLPEQVVCWPERSAREEEGAGGEG